MYERRWMCLEKTNLQNMTTHMTRLITKSFTLEKISEPVVEEAAALIITAFQAREPLAMLGASGQSGSGESEFKGYVIHSGRKCVEQGLGWVARCNETDAIVGALIGSDLTDTLHSKEFISEAKNDPIGSLIVQLNSGFFKEKTVESGTWFNIKFVAVSDSFTGQGVITDIVTRSLKCAAEKGFSFAHAEATGNISQHIFMNKFGFEEKNAIGYGDFIFKGSHPFAAIKEHKSIKLLIKGI